MMKIYRTQDKQLTRVDEIGEGCWVCLNNPDENEARLVASTLDIEPADLMAATDPEESARISLEDGYTLKKVELTALRLDKDGEIANYYMPQSDRLLYEALKEELFRDMTGGTAFETETLYAIVDDGKELRLQKAGENNRE